LLTVELSSRPVPASGNDERLIHAALLHVAKLRQTPRIWDDLQHEQQALEQAIARDLRAPLTMVSQHAHDALHLHGATMGSEVRLALERMQSAAVRAEITLQQLLDYCALSHESVTLDLVNIEELVQHVLIERRNAIAERGAEIAVARPLPCVRGARLVLGQVLSHLLTFALQAAQNRAAPRLAIAAETIGDCVVLKLTDPGLELPPGQGEQIFRVFERPDSAPAFPGSGVPLALVRRAVERMGDRVWLASAPAGGSAFHLELAGL
jgi:light-regulated signal transduction histidine kinase (bacteriophytochrome)